MYWFWNYKHMLYILVVKNNQSILQKGMEFWTEVNDLNTATLTNAVLATAGSAEVSIYGPSPATQLFTEIWKNWTKVMI